MTTVETEVQQSPEVPKDTLAESLHVVYGSGTTDEAYEFPIPVEQPDETFAIIPVRTRCGPGGALRVMSAFETWKCIYISGNASGQDSITDKHVFLFSGGQTAEGHPTEASEMNRLFQALCKIHAIPQPTLTSSETVVSSAGNAIDVIAELHKGYSNRDENRAANYRYDPSTVVLLYTAPTQLDRAQINLKAWMKKNNLANRTFRGGLPYVSKFQEELMKQEVVIRQMQYRQSPKTLALVIAMQAASRLNPTGVLVHNLVTRQGSRGKLHKD